MVWDSDAYGFLHGDCPDSANPCKHVAAVYYLVADEVDEDPFVLFLLRGRPRDDVLTELRARRAPTREEAPKLPKRVDTGLTPRAAYGRRLAPIPALPPPPRVAGRPAVLDLDPPPSTGWTTASLAVLAADAASLARDLLTIGPAATDLTFEEDLARRAAPRTRPEIATLAEEASVSLRDLTRWAEAWREGGRSGLAALRDTWQPGPGPLEQAAADLAESGLPGTAKAWRNRLTQGELQLRYGRDGRWYRFVRAGADWRLDGPSAVSALDLIY